MTAVGARGKGVSSQMSIPWLNIAGAGSGLGACAEPPLTQGYIGSEGGSCGSTFQHQWFPQMTYHVALLGLESESLLTPW